MNKKKQPQATARFGSDAPGSGSSVKERFSSEPYPAKASITASWSRGRNALIAELVRLG
jgi:hypothetical protein